MSDVTHAELQAVRELRNAVSRYAGQLRDVMAGVRRDAAIRQQRAQELVAQRQSRLNRAARDLQQAPARVDQARHELDRARKAAQMISAARSDLLKTLQHLEAVVGEQSSVSAAALATLEARLAEIVGGRLGRALTTLGVAAEVSVASVNVAKLAGDVTQGYLAPAEPPASMSQLQDQQVGHQQELYQESEALRLDRHSEDTGTP